jgi:membrane protein YdbS with pleckstrin-like domain
MRNPPNQQIDPRAISLWRVQGLFAPLFWGGAGAVALVLMQRSTTFVPTWFIAAFVGLVLSYAAFRVLVVPAWRWRYWRYEVDDCELYLQHGFLVIRRTVIPLLRIQHVDTTQGPVSKHFGLSAVRVSTAASAHEIPALADEVADNLRDRISQLAREAREQL